MGYRIVYGEKPFRKFGTCRIKKRLGTMTAGFFLLFLLLTNLCWPEGRQKLWEICIPGNAQVTAAAFEAMVEDLRAGESVSDALTVFCQEIIHNAEDSP